ncbi:polysaccharide export outer membrane protein [Idiomarina fontislapidosi]|uniref:Polysaccharide export protein Wza n=1 Tax=Idiomarina fontislapidosi TaxID=263723 RepID=A0A432XN43_9GAMM|nr:polysaccharide export protein [Idiomarina fontislapidosi]PYE30404.1 polysaccharide export outer membrane protein [Idiomarina fontislapidosi]RUO50093.1 polysaccharide export protein Wza [Idiomarina fontislapidosi]
MKRFLTVALTSLLISSCALSPGAHIPDPSGSSLLADSDYTSGEAFKEADWSDLVEIHAISPMLIAQLDAHQTSSEPQANPQLEQARNQYDYVVGRGDILNITVWDHPELTIPAGSMRAPAEAGNWVHNDGTIFYPYVGKIQVAGKRVTEIRELITERLATYIEKPQVDVTVAAFRSQRVYVTGEVKKPGTLPISNVPMTLIEAVSQSGGLTPAADWTEVTLTRGSDEQVYSLRDLYQRGDTQENIILKAGDIINVARNDHRKVFVLGEVTKPQSYPVGRYGTTLAEALSDAGGLYNNTADASGIFVIRQSQPDSGYLAQVFQLDASNATALVLAEQFELQPRDIVYVTAAPVARWNRVISQILPSVTGLYSIARARDDIQN